MLDDALVAIFTTIAATLFASELELYPGTPCRLEGEVLNASVHFRGDFEGVLLASFPRGLARTLTNAMMHMPPEASTQADVCDAVGEIANIIAGNLKGLLSGSVRISLPTVQVARGMCEEPAGNARIGRASMLLFGEPVLVQLLASEGPKQSA